MRSSFQAKKKKKKKEIRKITWKWIFRDKMDHNSILFSPFKVEDIEKQLNSEHFAHLKRKVIKEKSWFIVRFWWFGSLLWWWTFGRPSEQKNEKKKNEFDKFRLIWWFIEWARKTFPFVFWQSIYMRRPYTHRHRHTICIKSQPDHLFVLCHILHLLSILMRIYSESCSDFTSTIPNSFIWTHE